MTRILIALLALALMALPACTNNQLDPQKVVNDIKVGCGVLVPAATVLEILNLDPTMSVSAIVNLVCSGFKAQQAKLGAPLKGGDKVEYDVVVNGKPVHVVATVQ